MKISVMLNTSVFRGDHEADVTEAHEILPGETVEHLVARLMPDARPDGAQPFFDSIVLRRVNEPLREDSSR